ncbi:tetratricopeptide repeat protein [Fulvivirga sp. M361]|uniref:tetratricopeptide repeat protein n=1 Tax=Fulvivirga sp. M361 TaxID=2594266 RepID=UPI00117A08C7|nr:tetratricopeptide repeat protein [Fulvivirga sp. M361]TRX60613.1 tetratricopeptide repeat protein [Fulvivirga sp. M361]
MRPLLLLFFVLYVLGPRVSHSQTPEGIDGLFEVCDSLVDYGFMEEALALAYKITDESNSLGYELGKAKGLLGLARYHRAYAQYDSALYYLHSSLEIANVENAPSVKAMAHRWVGKTYGNLGQYDSAIHHFTLGEKAGERLPENDLLISILVNKTHVYNMMNDHKQGLSTARRALRLAPKSSYVKSDVYNALGSSFRGNKKNDSALYYYQKALVVAKDIGVSRKTVALLNNIAIVYGELERHQEALDLFLQTKEMDIMHSDTLGLTYSHIGVANAYLNIGEIDSALFHANKSLYWARYLNAEQRMEKAYESLISIHKEQGNSEELVRYFDLLLNLRNKLLEDSKYRTIKELETRFETEKKEQQIISLELEKRNEAILRNAYAVGLGLSVLIGLLIIFGLYDRIRKNRQLREKERQIALERFQSLQNELDGYTCQLKERTMRIEELNGELEKVKEEVSEKCPTYDKTLDRLMQSTILTNDEWFRYKQLFNQVHPGFFTTLRQSLKDLTDTEERLIALTKLNLQTKEIAAMLGISTESVNKSRYRLRKKLNVSSNEMESIVASL